MFPRDLDLLHTTKMSGGSSPGGYGDSSGGTVSGGDCDIVEVVPLNSPKAPIVAKLKLGDKLSVEIVGGSVVARDSAKNIAGSLTPRRLADLIACINKGREYVAIVRSLKGALCEVEVRPRV